MTQQKGVFSMLSACKGLEKIDFLLAQPCGGQSQNGNSGSLPNFEMNLNVPCKLLELNGPQLGNAFQSDIARLAGTETSNIINMQTRCDPGTIVTLVAGTAKPSSNLLSAFHHFHALAAPLQGTKAMFSIQAGDDTNDVKSRLDSKLNDPKTVTFSATELVVKAKCVDCPTIKIQSVASRESAQKINTQARCDPVLFMDVVSKCNIPSNWGSMSDNDAKNTANSVCSESSDCAKALAAIGKDIKFCEGDMTAMLSTMCKKNYQGTPCLVYSRQTDAGRTCSAKYNEAACNADPACNSRFSQGGGCELKITQDLLAGFCGECATAMIQANTNAKGDTADLEMMCVKAGSTFCAPLQYAQQAKQSQGKQSAIEICGDTVEARCAKMMATSNSASQMRRANQISETCTGAQCSQYLAQAKKQQASVDFQLLEGCKKGKDGEYCMDKMNNVGKAADDCFKAVSVSTECPANCTEVLSALMSNFGCCASMVQRQMLMNSPQSDSVSAEDASTKAPQQGLEMMEPCVSNIRSILAGECDKAPQKVHKKRLGLKVSCSDLTEEVRAALIAKIPEDLSAAIGVAKEAITNVDPKCDSAIVVTSADAAPAPAPVTNANPTPANAASSAPATPTATPKTRRQFRTLATSSGVAVDYTLKSTNDAETERASAELDRKVQNNDLVLPAAQTAVTEVCTTCASLDVDKSSSKTLAVEDEKSSSYGMRLTLLNIILPVVVFFALLL